MRERLMSPKKRHKGGKVLPALCNLLGILILLAIIASGLMLVLPQWRGYDVYHVVSGSMAPEIPIGSIVYVHPIAPEDVQSGEIIAFWSPNDAVITHRVVKNFIIEGEFSTKGDANPSEDGDRTRYEKLIGVVKYHYPFLGELLSFYSTIVGKIYIILFAACGAMLNILASRLRARHKVWCKPAKTRHVEEPTS
ncbi:MAG: signal peptidase I [Oscillospiraceae bacterium]|nr:signal peptidase I [Oscillospiraceae bacterium]